MKIRIVFQIVFLSLISFSFQALPVVFIHGIGDSCSFPGMSRIATFFSKNLDDVYTKCIETGGGPFDFFTSFSTQAKKACDYINTDPQLSGDFSIVGVSQGSLIARYIIQACEMKGRVKRYISIGGPQMGVGKFPHCDTGIICNVLNRAVDFAIYFSLVQNHIGPAGYFKDISNFDGYLKYSTFLADLNNEIPSKINNSYKERFTQLEKIVLIKFGDDTMIIPKETAWFQFYDENFEVQDLESTDFYKNDYIGVKAQKEAGNISFIELSGDHLSFDDDDILKFMIPALK